MRTDCLTANLVDAVGLNAAPGEARVYARSKPDGVSFDGFEEAARNLAEGDIVETAEVEQRDEELSLAEAPGGDTMLTALGKLMGSPDLCSRRWIWEQYDHTVMGDTIIAPGGDAALVRVHGTNRALAISTDVAPRYVKPIRMKAASRRSRKPGAISARRAQPPWRSPIALISAIRNGRKSWRSLSALSKALPRPVRR